MTALMFLAAPAALAFLLVGIHAYLGLHVLERDVIFVDIGLSQVAALGGAISLFFTSENSSKSVLFSLGCCLFVAFALALLRRIEKKISQEALIGMTFALASGLLIIVADRLPHGAEHIQQALVGNILFVTWPQVRITAEIYAAIGLIHWIFRDQFWACSRGDAPSFWWDFLFYVLFAIVITFSTHHAGVLVVFSILVAPAALSSRFFSTAGARLIAAWIFGLAGVLLAFVFSYKLDFPAGAAIVSALTAGFFAILAAALITEGIKARSR